ncbi:HI0074 family nucleotidyltransferase substrate-binding subunit [Natribacillus halophilus]|uniref:Nucleotidyltransferase substrate binding protein, HI0074 family n=1 Tax=Natribacillus halophilus TaxID=549003 RepID=A0A1G8S3T5_9BACI|nr:HI0074 family nucleotidyltransferase substrate-binding subunit [Natribacillus halophilus]SDJ23445.1 nucleotidyltransferase substrate binding protein, HI0074 family [Natribacillus halophilus]
MERLQERIATADKALKTLEDIHDIETPSSIIRDGFIQRFKYTYESAWKLAREYLREIESLDLGSPKRIIHASREIELLSAEETVTALQMADDRNLTTHTYNETLADQIYKKIPGYAKLMRTWWEKMISHV